ncbi:MAG: RagB/SusD family nutrient uptake outer membrane protein, partial [Dysgonamonadaceae bacterium]|nr:RagB/SusD family nutrient uptake outer membrane protein [Dysgonamonadaceae bacterium]
QYREPVDTCVNYIASLLDEAAALLPLTVDEPASDQGLPDRCIALALKAELLTLAASPLFNCNEDYADYRDNRGVQLFPQDKSQEKAKWERAATALKAAIDVAREAGYDLYDFQTAYPAGALLSNETKLAMQVRGAATDVWNREIIWGNSRINNNSNLQIMCNPYMNPTQGNSGNAGFSNYAPTLQIVEQFYTDNGLPIEDDAEWEERDVWQLRTAGESHKQYIRQGYQTIQLHFNREPRFYGAIVFDGGTLFGNSRITQDNSTDASYMWVTEMKYGQSGGWAVPSRSSLTGYLAKKMIHYRSLAPVANTSYVAVNYAFSIIRLGDLYLLYSEALNESKDAPDAQVYEYIDLVRARTGLEGVVKTWNEHALADKKNKPLTKDGMRDIIRRERLNELAFEGARFWDLRRWKLAEEYINRPIRGLNVMGEKAEDYYVETVLYQPIFEKKDYFFPVRTQTVIYNLNLLQSPGWN